MDNSDALIRSILQKTRVIACVGASINPARPSHIVGLYLVSKGLKVIPVNPVYAGQTLFGQEIYPDLASVPIDAKIDMVDIFRRSEFVPPIVDQALKALPDLATIWMQIGVEHAESAKIARDRGVNVIQNRCPKIEYSRLIGQGQLPRQISSA